jgi:NTE family protein
LITKLNQRIGLALGGGGARGLCHIEFIKALDEMGLKPSIISGTSIGAMIGGFYAAGISGIEMEEVLEKVGIIEIGKMVDFSIFGHTGLVKGRGVEEFLEKYLPFRTFEQLPIPLKVVATDYWHRKEVILDSGELIPAIRASISVPAVFVPAVINGTVMIDGGVVNPVPYDIIRNQSDILIAIDVSGTMVPHKKDAKPSMFESVMNSYQILEDAVLGNKMKFVKPDLYIRPALKNIQILEFFKDAQIRKSVRTDVIQFKKDLGKLIGLEVEVEEKPKKKKRFFWF